MAYGCNGLVGGAMRGFDAGEEEDTASRLKRYAIDWAVELQADWKAEARWKRYLYKTRN